MSKNNEREEEFVTLLKNRLQQYPYPLIVNDLIVEKNNGVKIRAISIAQEGCQNSIFIYPESVLENNSDPVSDIVSKFIGELTIHLAEIERLSTETEKNIKSFSSVKSKIIYKLINAKSNELSLKGKPHREVCGDLALVYQVLLPNDNKTDQLVTTTITNEILSFWNVTEEELYNIAKSNTPALLPAKVFSMDNLIPFFSQEQPLEKQMFIITNEATTCGAAAILYDDCKELKTLADKIGTDLYILPSSINECIIMSTHFPDAADEDQVPEKVPENLTQMVNEVNTSAVPDEQILSDHPYLYNRDTGRIFSF